MQAMGRTLLARHRNLGKRGGEKLILFKEEADLSRTGDMCRNWDESFSDHATLSSLIVGDTI